ncbi:MAG TPA: lyase family protein [Gemmatimonadales bacterium]|nr:lyase family protein [Gemmatimonadales bacterium]
MRPKSKRRRSKPKSTAPASVPTTLWQHGHPMDVQMLDYTAAEDRLLDSRLLAWDVLGSLGHVEGLWASKLLSPSEHRELKAGLRSALKEVELGRLVVGPEHEDVHTAVEDWLTRRIGPTGERLHTGRSRNDQVACDLRLFLKDRLLLLQGEALDLAESLLSFAEKNQDALWPGYTHQRLAMPSSAGLWAGAFAEGILDTVEALPALYGKIDRSPLGSAAGYGVPLPLRREAAARALGFASVEHNVALVQAGRGKLEAAVLFWCTQLGHELAKLSADIILFSGDEFGFLILPADLATGSSLMPHKRNPDLFELTRGRAAALEGDLITILQLKGKLASGYHRDFQLIKEPLMRGVDRLEGMLSMMAVAIPRLSVDRAACLARVSGGALATDEVMRRVEGGQAFRSAYREVAAAIREGDWWREPSADEIMGRRRSMGMPGNLGLNLVRTRLRASRRWATQEQRRFDRAMARLAGNGAAGGNG